MKKIFSLLLLSAVIISCNKEKIRGSGSIITQERQHTAFTDIRTSGSSNLHIIHGNEFKVEVRGYSNLLPHYQTRVSNSTLFLGYKQGVNISNDNIEVFITMPTLALLSTSGSGNVEVEGDFGYIPDLEILISGSGDIRMEEALTDNFRAHISGSGDINTEGVTAQMADIQIDGSGNTKITVSQELKVRINGSGNVYYLGSPDLDIVISGSGQVSHL